MIRIGLITSADHPDLTGDDRPLVPLLAELGFEARPVVWSAPNGSLQFHTLVLRSCWDYHLNPKAFDAWLGTVERSGTRLWNPVSVVRWNLHKGYLRALAERGVPVPRTVWVDRGSQESLAQILSDQRWPAAIVKPAISASATDTFRAEPEERAERRFRELVARSEVLVQEIVAEVMSDGEWSVVFVDGEFSHGVMKRPRAGDFRVQSEYGGTADLVRPPQPVIDAAAEITRHIPQPWLFARIDGVSTAEGFVLMEIECIEPHLFFALAPGSRSRFARALARRVREPAAAADP